MRWIEISELAPVPMQKYFVVDSSGNHWITTWDDKDEMWLIEHSVPVAGIVKFMPLQWGIDLIYTKTQ